MKNKAIAILVSMFLLIIMSSSMVLLPTTTAHSPPWTFVSYAYIVAAPNPVGVGQTASVVMWIDDPFPGASVTNDIRRHDYTLTITKPDGTTETQKWPIVLDSTGMQFFQFAPDQVGNYTLKFDYPAQNYTWTAATSPGASSIYAGDMWLGDSDTINLVVQQAQVAPAIDSFPLPTQYWTRPIEGENTYWYSIASNWLGSPYVIGAGAGYGIPGAVQTDGTAPNSAHVMWTKPIQYGGVVGGNDTAVPGEMYYSGLSYNVRFANPIIMQGMLFYQEPFGNGAGGGDYIAVDLQTGKELWRINASATGVSLVPSFGYLYSYESPNQHGVLPNGLLIASYNAGGSLGTVWKTYDPRTGVLTPMTISNIPSGTRVAGPSGEILMYSLTNLGTAANPKWYLSEWNSSKVFGGGSGLSPANWYTGGIVPANAPLTPTAPANSYWNGTAWAPESSITIPGFGTIYSVPAGSPYAAVTNSAYDWNISLPSLTGTGWNVGIANLGVIPLINVGNMMLLTQGTFGGHPGDYYATVSADPANVTAISLNSGQVGSVMWSKTYQPAPGNNTRLITDWDPSNGVFVVCDKESMVHYGFSLADGSQLWGPTVLPNDFTADYNYMAIGLERIAYGKLYWAGYAGILYAYDDKTGNLQWTYGNGGEGNSTYSGLNTPYGRYPVFISTIADGKVYLDTTEHSPNSPLYKGAELRAINATDGTETWTILDYGQQMYGGQSPVADGYLTTLNSYDSQIYCYGKGPSAMTVTAPDVATSLGSSIVIRGTVLDVAAGTQQYAQKANFPYGVPAVSDNSESSFMEAVYMQKPMPNNITGVPVSLYVLDSNGNYRQIGTATSDVRGMFTYTWTPDITGSYTVYASFAGSNSYYPSSAESSFTVDAAAPTATATSTQVTSLPPMEMYFAASTIAIIIAIAIVGIVILRKKP